MNSKIVDYIESAFHGVNETKKVKELKDELILNLTEKYNDEIKFGKTPNEAYNYVISGIGDISELVESVNEPSPLKTINEGQSKKSALFVSIAVMLYIMSPFTAGLVIFISRNPMASGFAMFFMIALATGLLIYNNMTKTNYKKADETIVEEFKEFCSKNPNKKNIYKSLKSAFWSLIVVIYITISFLFDIWETSWLIFILAAAIEKIIEAVIMLKENNHE